MTQLKFNISQRANVPADLENKAISSILIMSVAATVL